MAKKSAASKEKRSAPHNEFLTPADIAEADKEIGVRSPEGSGGEFPLDEEFIPGGPREEREFQEKFMVDALLAGVPQNDTYYLKLLKVMPDGNVSFRRKLEGWQNWSDLELQINTIVKQATLKEYTDKGFIASWGSGTYRLVVWREGGLRHPYKPIDFCVDAEEPIAKKAEGAAMGFSPDASLDSLSKLMGVVKQMNPTADPTETNKQISEAISRGIELAKTEKAGEATTMAAVMQSMGTMMTAMMTMMMQNVKQPHTDPLETYLKLAALNKPPDSLGDLLKFKELGLLNIGSPTDKLKDVKEIVSIAGELGGLGGDKSSTLDRIVDLLVPKVPDMIKDVTGAVQGYVEASRMRYGANPQKPAVRPNINGGDEKVLFGFHPLFKELYQAALNNDVNKFPYIVEKISGLLGDQLVKDIVTGTLSPEQVTGMIRQYGGSKFKDAGFQPKLTAYINSFCAWCKASFDVKQHVKHPDGTVTPVEDNIPEPTHAPMAEAAYITKCNTCGDEVQWPSEASFKGDDNHVCGLEIQPGQFCDGELVPMDGEPEPELEVELPQ